MNKKMRLLNRDASRRPTQVKICGITRIEDAELASKLGVEAIGLNFHPASPRYVDPERAASIRAAIPKEVDAVGVFVNLPTAEVRAVAERVGLSAVQLHGNESAEAIAELQPIPVIKAFRCRDVATIGAEMTSFLAECGELGAMPVGLLLDGFDPHAEGGTGKRWDWEKWQRSEMTLPWLLAGGLRPNNVEQAMRACRPSAVDVASGIESSPGVKDAMAMRQFIEAVDRWNGTLAEAGSALE